MRALPHLFQGRILKPTTNGSNELCQCTKLWTGSFAGLLCVSGDCNTRLLRCCVTRIYRFSIPPSLKYLKRLFRCTCGEDKLIDLLVSAWLIPLSTLHTGFASSFIKLRVTSQLCSAQLWSCFLGNLRRLQKSDPNSAAEINHLQAASTKSMCTSVSWSG